MLPLPLVGIQRQRLAGLPVHRSSPLVQPRLPGDKVRYGRGQRYQLPFLTVAPAPGRREDEPGAQPGSRQRLASAQRTPDRDGAGKSLQLQRAARRTLVTPSEAAVATWSARVHKTDHSHTRKKGPKVPRASPGEVGGMGERYGWCALQGTVGRPRQCT